MNISKAKDEYIKTQQIWSTAIVLEASLLKHSATATTPTSKVERNDEHKNQILWEI